MNRADVIGDQSETLREAINSALRGTWNALPAIVETADLSAQTITARPAIKARITDVVTGRDSDVELPLLVDVPICFPRGGGYSITFPLDRGDDVLIIFSSRCIDGWWKFGSVQPQTQFRMHDLSDGFAIPGPTSQPNRLANVNASALEIRGPQGKTFTLNGTSLSWNGDLSVTGKIHASGEIQSDTDVKAGPELSVLQISLLNHRHSLLKVPVIVMLPPIPPGTPADGTLTGNSLGPIP